jgi:hypothetical protein
LIDADVARFGADGVVVAFDLDNTTLATDRDLGSEHWFLWQSGLIGAGETRGRVADSVPALLHAQSFVLALSPMHVTDPAIVDAVRELGPRGVRFLIVTSRGADVRDATLRELARNGLALDAVAPGPAGGYAATYVPYDRARPEASGLSRELVDRLRLGAAQPVRFEGGVFFTGGQHKGALLRTLLAKTGTTPRAIVFMDDRLHHLEGVEAAFAGDEGAPTVETVRFRHERARIAAFDASDKREVRQAWCAFATGLTTGLPRLGGEEPWGFAACPEDGAPAAAREPGESAR